MGTCPTNYKLFVDLFHKGNQFIIGSKSTFGVGSHACNCGGSIKIGRSGTLGGSPNLGFQNLDTVIIRNIYRNRNRFFQPVYPAFYLGHRIIISSGHVHRYSVRQTVNLIGELFNSFVVRNISFYVSGNGNGGFFGQSIKFVLNGIDRILIRNIYRGSYTLSQTIQKVSVNRGGRYIHHYSVRQAINLFLNGFNVSRIIGNQI